MRRCDLSATIRIFLQMGFFLCFNTDAVGGLSCPYSSVTAMHRGNNPQVQKVTMRRFAHPVEKTDEEWRSILPPDAYTVLRQDGTEPPYTSLLNSVTDAGTFTCAGCDSPLFRTSSKFDSKTGWPSFYQPLDSDAVALSSDFKLILPRTEVRCANCGGHLGHVFEDGPDPTGLRYCMNGVAMKFRPDDDCTGEFREEVQRREDVAMGSSNVKMPLMSTLPTVLLYAAAAVGYGSSFLARWNKAGDVGMPFPSSVLDAVPLLIAGLCGFLAVRGVLRLI